MQDKIYLKKKWIASLTLVIALFGVMGTNMLTIHVYATLDVQARQKAAAVMNLIDQSLGYYANATGSKYVEREHLPSNTNVTTANMAVLSNVTSQPIVSQADYQI